MEQRPRRIPRWRYWTGLVLLIILFTIVIAFEAGRLQAYVVTTESMAPTIKPGDHLLVFAKSPTVPGRGDIVALRNPKNTADGLCKRVVAIPNDVVEIRDGHFYLNGAREDYEGDLKTSPMLIAHKDPVKLEQDEYFVLGDNRDASFDSSDESFGTVHGGNFIGKAIVIYWPIRRLSSLSAPQAEKGNTKTENNRTASR